MKLYEILLAFEVLSFSLTVVYSKYNLEKVFESIVNPLNSKTTKKTNVKFSFNNCGPNTDILTVNSLLVYPEPLKLPGNINLTGSASIKSDIKGPLQMTIKAIRKIGPIKLEIPCIDNVGSCTYNDVCEMLPNPDSCPDYFKKNGIPCACPFPSGAYSAQNVLIEVDIPDVIPPGQYEILANFQKKEGHVACVQIEINLA